MVLKRNVRGGQPSPYPRILFHALRSAQLLGALVVSGIMIYFMYYLRKEEYPIPWTFIVLLSVSFATIAALIVTIVIYNFTYLSPRFNLILNGSISLIWALGLGLLTWSIAKSNVLQSQCTAETYGGAAGSSICRDYKALWSMTLCGTVSTFLAFILDVHTQRKIAHRGVYVKPADDQAAERLNNMKTMQVRSEGYEAPQEQNDHNPVWLDDGEDIAYHNRYGTEEPQGPAKERRKKDVGNQFGPFRD